MVKKCEVYHYNDLVGHWISEGTSVDPCLNAKINLPTFFSKSLNREVKSCALLASIQNRAKRIYLCHGNSKNFG